MAQRWMQAKMLLARKHGIARSGCNRATGGVWDDVKIGYRDERVPGTVKKRKYTTARRAPEDRPIAWGQGRKARRAAQSNK